MKTAALQGPQGGPPLPAVARQPVQDPSFSIVPVHQIGNVRLLPRDDEVLRFLALQKDEREFCRMRKTEPKIATPIRSLSTLVMSFGYQPELPEGLATPARKLLKERAEAIVKRMERLPDVLEMAFLSAYEGWMLFQNLYPDEPLRPKGARIWAPAQMRDFEKHRHHFSFTPEWDLALVPPDGHSPTVYPKDSEGWTVFRSGSTSSPYGGPMLSELWLLWEVKQKFRRYFVRGVRDAANGILAFREENPSFQHSLGVGETDGGDGSTVMASIVGEVREVLKRFEKDGVLILRAGIIAEILENKAFLAGWKEAFDYIDMQFQLAIEFQHLTAEQPTATGSYASSQTHMQTKMAAGQRLARKLKPALERGWIWRVLELNEGEIDPEDLPPFGFNITRFVDRDNVKTLVDMGLRLDGEPIADQWNVTIAAPDAEPGTVLERRAAPAAVTFQPGEPSGEEKGGGQPKPPKQKPPSGPRQEPEEDR